MLSRDNERLQTDIIAYDACKLPSAKIVKSHILGLVDRVLSGGKIHLFSRPSPEEVDGDKLEPLKYVMDIFLVKE